MKSLSHKRQYAYTSYRKLRSAVIEILGGKCQNCGFTDVRALQVDHVHGAGTDERTHISRKTGKKYINGGTTYKNVLERKPGYRLLCANCNWIKKAEQGEHRNYKNALGRVDTQEGLPWVN